MSKCCGKVKKKGKACKDCPYLEAADNKPGRKPGKKPGKKQKRSKKDA